MMINDAQDLDAILRQDLASFIAKVFEIVCPDQQYLHNWHIDLIADRLEACRRGEIKRLIITMPPRSLKSMMVSIAFVAFVLGHDPRARIICASYAQDLADKLARDCRALMTSLCYRRLFPGTRISANKNTAAEFTTTKRGSRLATSVGGTLTGRGGNIVIIDDPLKPLDALSDAAREAVNNWFDHTLYSRLDNKEENVIVVVMQRLHVDDPVAHLLAKGGSWVHLNLPAIAETLEDFVLADGRHVGRRVGEALHPERESVHVLEDIKREIGSLTFAAQYQQDPAPLEGGHLKWTWFKVYDAPPARQPGDLLVHSWDTACKAAEIHDYSVCTVWLVRGPDHYLLEVHRKRLEYPALKKWVVTLALQDRPDVVLIEDNGSGTQLIQELRAETDIRPIPILPKGDKVMRAMAQSAKIEAGCVYLPAQAPWLEDFKREVLSFPQGRFDDQVDSMVQLLAWAFDRFMADAEFIMIESAYARSIATDLPEVGPSPWSIWPVRPY
jgi:predicted phage terminase large subunit-like protein